MKSSLAHRPAAPNLLMLHSLGNSTITLDKEPELLRKDTWCCSSKKQWPRAAKQSKQSLFSPCAQYSKALISRKASKDDMTGKHLPKWSENQENRAVPSSSRYSPPFAKWSPSAKLCFPALRTLSLANQTRITTGWTASLHPPTPEFPLLSSSSGLVLIRADCEVH